MSKSNNKRDPRQSTSIEKGKIVEGIVALLHEQPGISVKRNVHLLSTDGEETREIDVLISGQLVGYPVRIAIESKNYKREIGKADIDAFIGKLNDLGFPTQHGIYVSTSRYTKGALKRAKNAEVRTLRLDGLTKDRLSAAIYDALQSIVYLLPIMASLSFFNDAPEMSPQEIGTFVNESGESFMIIDLIWQNWCKGKYPMNIGEHSLEVKVPTGYTQLYKGKRLASVRVALTLQVIALVVQIPGRAQHFQLTNPFTSSVEKKKVTLSFETESGLLAVNTFQTEEELHTFLESRPQQFSLTLGRIAIPRILTPRRVLWPPSQRYMDNINRLIREKGENINFQELDVFALQGDHILEAAFDDIWEGHPASAKKAKAEPNTGPAKD